VGEVGGKWWNGIDLRNSGCYRACALAIAAQRKADGPAYAYVTAQQCGEVNVIAR